MQETPEMAGKVYGIGVGPGDPELMTVKAVEVLQRAGHVFAPISRDGSTSIALETAQRFIPAPTPVTKLLFPMLKDKRVLHDQWMKNYEAIRDAACRGADCAFITLGDPGIYSTFSVIAGLFKAHSPDIEIETIPGIPSFCHAAARAGMTLVEGDEILAVASANDTRERIGALIKTADTAVFLKTYRDRNRLLDIVKDCGFLSCCTYMRRCGMQGEEVIRECEKLPDDPDYLSLIIVKKPHEENG